MHTRKLYYSSWHIWHAPCPCRYCCLVDCITEILWIWSDTVWIKASTCLSMNSWVVEVWLPSCMVSLKLHCQVKKIYAHWLTYHPRIVVMHYKSICIVSKLFSWTIRSCICFIINMLDILEGLFDFYHWRTVFAEYKVAHFCWNFQFSPISEPTYWFSFFAYRNKCYNFT